jgi:hypothetical protein
MTRHRCHRSTEVTASGRYKPGGGRVLAILYEGPADGATFHVPWMGLVRFAFANLRASGFVRLSGGSLAYITSGTRHFLPSG